MRLHALAAGVSGLLVLLLAVPSAGAATPTGCDLVTAQTAASLAGEAVGAPKDAEAKDKEGTGCKYTSKSGANIGIAVVNMAKDDANSYVAAMKSMVVAPAESRPEGGDGAGDAGDTGEVLGRNAKNRCGPTGRLCIRAGLTRGFVRLADFTPGYSRFIPTGYVQTRSRACAGLEARTTAGLESGATVTLCGFSSAGGIRGLRGSRRARRLW